MISRLCPIALKIMCLMVLENIWSWHTHIIKLSFMYILDPRLGILHWASRRYHHEDYHNPCSPAASKESSAQDCPSRLASQGSAPEEWCLQTEADHRDVHVCPKTSTTSGENIANLRHLKNRGWGSWKIFKVTRHLCWKIMQKSDPPCTFPPISPLLKPFFKNTV